MLDAMLRDFAKDGVESWAEIGGKVWNLINLKEKFSQQDKYLITLIDVVVVVVVVSVATFGLIVAFVVTVVDVSVTVLVVMSVL